MIARQTASRARCGLSLDPLIAEAKRRARQRRLLLGALAILIAGGTIGTAIAVRSPSGSSGTGARAASRQIPNAALADCARPVPGPGFYLYACMSGGARAGYPHPKELLVVRNDGSSIAYPAFRIGEPAYAAGEVIAVYNDNLVRVTSSRLVPLVTTAELAHALHTRWRPIDDIYAPSIDAHGDVYLHASVAIAKRYGCENRILERTAAGAIRQISLSSRNHICS